MDTQAFIRLLNSPFKFRLYLFSRIPSAWFSGLRIREADEDRCAVTVPFRWFTKNPFRSTYFACLGMAAEMSTGCLAMTHLYRRNPAVSMLVTGMEARFFKKATGLTTFVCAEGAAMRQAIGQAVTTGEGQTIRVRSAGMNSAGDEIAEFFITWSFKVRG
ncbi:MAG TPA: DUF4442 domain-containing protein [Puia sp.]|jgi:hypothetical protein|nr:DUF4442 domain-containing protein [Puia sp.]